MTRTFKALLACLAMLIAAVGVAAVVDVGPAQAAASNHIVNGGDVGVDLPIGIIHIRDGKYGANGTASHDYALYPSKSSASVWATVAGFYVSYGYCATVYHTGTGGGTNYNYGPSTARSGYHWVTPSMNYWVRYYRCLEP